jgi:hypothetical protein
MTAKWTRSETAILANHPTPERRLARKVREGDAIAQAVVSAPASHNRALRRSVGLWGSIWRWDLNASEETRRTFVPRYIRRHFSNRIMLVPTTRRQRRERARILRVSRQKGIVT